jgi:hypothetical protein
MIDVLRDLMLRFSTLFVVEKQKSIGSFVLPIPIVPLVNISSMPYLESEQQDETRNVTEYDSEKAAVTDAQDIMFCLLP